MNLKTILGGDYKEDMTLAEIEAALADKKLVDPSTLPKSVNKDVFDKTASELAKVKKDLKELQDLNMTAEEKVQAELKKASETQANYQKELAKLKAKEIFVGAGLSEAEYTNLLDTVVSEDAETTKARATSLVELIAAQKDLTDKAVRAELLKGTPRPSVGSGSSGSLEKEIEDARAAGDMATVAALIRQNSPQL